MLKNVLKIDQYVLGIFQCISSVAYEKGVNNFRLAVISYLPSIIIIAIDLITQDKIFIEGINKGDEIIGFKLIVFFSLLICCVMMILLSTKKEKEWSEKISFKNTEKHEWDTVILRVCCLVAGLIMAMFAAIDLISCYLNIFFITNACAFYFLSCEPGNTDLLKHQDGLAT